MLTRFPRLGQVKTRIAADLGDDAALDLHDRLVRHTLKQLLALSACGEARVEVRTDASFVHANREWLGAGPKYRYQGDGDLGKKLYLAFAEGFSRGDEAVVVVGSDCPGLKARHLRQALAALSTHDVVIGPAADGGYYLIGLSRRGAHEATAELLRDTPWGTAEVLAQTRNVAENLGFSVALLEVLADVDRPEDVPAAEAELVAERLSANDRVSVIVPALQEEASIDSCVRSAVSGGAHEVVVVDGGSTDATVELATRAGAIVAGSEPGRAVQLNAGAACASGELLCFLHADTLLPPLFADAVREALGQGDPIAVAFDFRVSGPGWRSRLVGTLGNARWRLTRLPYGDQAVCMHRSIFELLGGFPDQPTMEDYEVALRLQRLGRIGRVPLPALTSPRSWQRYGLVWPTVVNFTCIAGYRLGFSPVRLARLRALITPVSGRAGGVGCEEEASR